MDNTIHHENWQDLMAKYRHDWVLAAKELLGIALTEQQKVIVESIQKDGAAVTVTTPEGVGTHSVLATISILHTILYPDALTILIHSPGFKKGQRFRSHLLYSHMQIQWSQALRTAPFLNELFKLTQIKLANRHNKWSGFFLKSYRIGLEESLAGFYSENSLFIIADAANVSDTAYKIVLAGMTGENSRILLTSIPKFGQTSGFFYESHHQREDHNNTRHKAFTSIQLNSEESPLVTPQYLHNKAKELGGRDTPEYRTSINGKFN